MGPEAGGGHTYEREILDALALARQASRHKIVAAGYAPEPPNGWDPGSYITLSQTGGGVAGKVRRRVARTIGRGQSRGSRSPVDSLFESNGIDLVWCLAAGCPTRVLPYVTTIWDLQHRIQPVFPEVAAGDEWANRESFFSAEIGRATVVIVGTAAGQAEVERFYGVPTERIRKLPHPTPSFALDPSGSRGDGDARALAQYGLEPGYVLYPAQFWAHKNHVGLLRAIKLLGDEHDLHLPVVFVGSDKGNLGHVRRVAESLGLGSQVHFLGFVPRSDLVTLYRNAFALAYVTFFGPDNLPPLEAFALGCPVVASAVAGAHEQLGDAALLVPPADESGIAEALFSLHGDESLRLQLVQRGHERARAFTSAHYVKGMLDIMDDIELTVRTWR